MAMYLDFYHLKKAPFHITPDPDFLFLSPSHKGALGCIIYGIEERQGFVAITGEVGLGKTTILRSYLERVDQRQLKTIYIFNANVSFRGLLKAVFGEFGLEFETEDLFEMVNRLHQVLIEEYRQGRNVALIIDEAQNMPVETLENLRMLSNLETSTEKLVQIVLIGQPEFEQKLNLNELRQLKQRLVIRSVIAPLTDAESMAYIQHRLAKVAVTEERIFTKKALKLIIEKAKGTPRVLNILSTNALISGFGHRKKPISTRIVKGVIADFEEKRKVPLVKLGFASLAVAAACIGLFWISPYRDAVISKIDRIIYLDHQEKTRKTFESISAEPKNPQNNSKIKFDSMKISYQENINDYFSADTNRKEDHKIEKNNASYTDEKTETEYAEYDTIFVKESEKTAKKISLDTQKEKSKVLPLTRVIRDGEYISKIALEVYGFTNDEVIAFIKKHNPHIVDIDKIEVGDKILFPEFRAAAE